MADTNTNNSPDLNQYLASPEKAETVNRPQELERRNRIERFLTLAAAGDKDLTELVKNPETLNWLIGMVEKAKGPDGRELGDGTEQYLSQQMLRNANRERIKSLNLEKRREDARKTSTADVDPFIRDIEATRKEFIELAEKDKNFDGKVLDKFSMRDVQSRLLGDYDRSFLAAGRTAFTEAGHLVIEAVSLKVPCDKVLSELKEKFEAYLDPEAVSRLEEILDNKEPIDAVVRDKALAVLAATSTVDLFPEDAGIKAARALVIKGAKEQTIQSKVLKEIEKSIGVAVTNETKVALKALLDNGSAMDNATRDKTLKLLTKESLAETAKKDIKDELNVIDTAKRLNVARRFTERADFNNRFGGSNAETLLNFATVDGALKMSVLQAQLKALNVDIPDAEIIDELKKAGVDTDNGNELPADWKDKKKEVVTFLQTKGLTNPAGVDLKRVTADVDDTLPWFDSKGPDRVKGYTANIAKMGKEAGEIWLKWIISLQENVIPQNEDVELNKLLKHEAVLKQALKAVERLDAWSKTTEESMKSSYDTLKSMQKDIDAKTGKAAPARGPSEQAEQAGTLLKTARTIMDELKSTNFALEKNPRVRKTAFRLAMTLGVDEARDYLNNPEKYAFEHPELTQDVLAYDDRTNKAEDLSGRDILTPLYNNLGVRVQANALTILSRIKGPNGMSVNPDTMLSDPAGAEAMLTMILYEDAKEGKAGGKDMLIAAYTRRQDVPGLTAKEADDYVRAIHQHLTRQVSDYNVSQRLLAKGSQSFDVVGGVRGAMGTLRNMMGSSDPAEKALGWGLALGGVYALWRGLKSDQWRNWIVGAGIFVGLDVAVERATGNSILNRLKMTFMNEKDRNSALEQFIRKGSKVEGYEELDDATGREATKQLMNPKDPIPVGDLLKWRMAVTQGGNLNYALCAPKQLKPSRIPIGDLQSRNMDSKTRKQEAYRILFLAFESLCINVADANALGGTNAKEKAEKGAALIAARYANRNESFPAEMGMDAAFKTSLGSCPGGEFSMLDVLVRERPTPAMQDALGLSTFPELALAKLGVAADKAKNGIAAGASTVEIKGRDLADKAPAAIETVRKFTMDSFDSFMDWARPTLYKSSIEVKEDMLALYKFLSRTLKQTGLVIVEKTPGVLEWTYNKSIDITKFTKDKAVDLYRELHRHQVVGNMLEGFEAMFETLFGESIQDADIAELSKAENIRKDLQHIVGKAVTTVGSTPVEVTDGWLADLGIIDRTTKAELLTPAERMLKVDLLKREIFSYIAAERLLEIKSNMGDPTYRPGKTPLAIGWPKTFNVARNRIETVEPAVKEAYEYIRSRYTTNDIVALIGQENAIPNGVIDEYAAKYPDKFTGQAAAFGDFLIDWATRNESSEYLAHDLKVYRDELFASPEFEALTPEEKDNFKSYVDTLLVNVMLESAVAEKGIGPSDLKLTIANAKRYLYNLRTRRGKTPVDIMKNQKDLLSKFAIEDKDSPKLLNDVINDTNGKWLLRGKEPPVPTAPTPAVPGAPVPPGGPTPPGAPPGTPSTPAPTPTNNPSVINALLATPATEMVKEDVQESMLLGLRDPQGKEAEMRAKFDTTLTNLDGKPYATAANKSAYHNYVRGVSQGNVKKVEDGMLSGMTKAEHLDDLVALRAKPELVAAERARVQHALDRGVVKVLEGISSELGAADPATLDTNDVKRSEWREQLARLYNASSSSTDPLLPDTISMALEFIHHKGDYSAKDIASYNAFLQSRGLPLVSTTPPTRSLYERTVGKDNVAAERFSSGGKLRKGDIKTLIDARVRKAKTALGR